MYICAGIPWSAPLRRRPRGSQRRLPGRGLQPRRSDPRHGLGRRNGQAADETVKLTFLLNRRQGERLDIGDPTL